MKGLILACCFAHAASAAAQDHPTYPRRIDFEAGHVFVHAPQIHAWKNYETIEGVSILEAHRTDSEDVVFAGALFTASAVLDVARRMVTVDNLDLRSVSFADGTPAKSSWC